MATSGDAAAFSIFTCAAPRDPDLWDLEVEKYVQDQAILWLAQPSGADPRMWVLTTASGELVAIGAHHQEMFWESDPEQLGRRVHFVAVGTSYQGSRAPDGRRYSDIILEKVIDDLLLRFPQDPVVTAVVHGSNTRSMALFFRHGFASTAVWQGEYVVMW